MFTTPLTAKTSREIKLRETVITLNNIDYDSVDSARIISVKKEDYKDPIEWYGLMYTSLGIPNTHPTALFNVKITSCKYSAEDRTVRQNTFEEFNIPGKQVLSHFFNKPKSANFLSFADIVKVEATSSKKFGTKYSVACIFVKN